MPYVGNSPTSNFASVTKDAFSGDGSTTAFTLSKAATTNGVAVFVENVRQEPTTAYAVSGTTLTFTAAPVSASGNNIYVLHHNAPASTATHPAAQPLTATSGTFTGAFTSLGIDDNADATAITITSDEAVGIGKSLTPNNYSGYQSLTIGGSDATTGSTVDLEDSSGNLEGRINGTNGIVYVEADPAGATGSSKISLEVDGTARMTIDSGGDIDVETGDIFFSTAGKGINLGVTSNTDANTLDDYEEGTFDLTAHNANLTLTDNSSYGVGRYVKVGRLVTCFCALQVSSVSSTNAVFLTMPFTAQADPTGGQNESSGSGFFSGPNIGDAGLAWYWAGGSNLVTFYKNNDDAGGAQLLNSDLAANDEMYFTATCFANS